MHGQDMADSRPNIILLLTDNHPVDHVGCMSDTLCRTPTFDRIGGEGVCIENMRTTSPLCSPARASLFTGFHPHQAGVPTAHLPWKDQWGIETGHGDEVFTKPAITEQLRRVGYQCLYGGKWHVGTKNMETTFDRSVAADEGFEDYMSWCKVQGIPNGFLFRDPQRGKKFRFHQYPHMVQPHTAPLDIAAEHEHNRWMLTNAVELFEQRDRQRPLFMVFSTYGPHPPLSIPEPYYSMYDPADVPKPADWGVIAGEPSFYENCYYRRMFKHQGENFDDWRKVIAVSWGYATYIDALYAQVVARLEAEGMLDNALLIMASDHGDMMGRRGLWRLFVPYEASIRAPWLMRWPGVIQPGTRLGSDVSIMDVGATILDAAGVELAPLGLEAESVLPYVTGQRTAPPVRDCFSQFDQPPTWDQWFGVEDWRCIVRRPWKYVLYLNAVEELYHLKNDPLEARNLAMEPAFRAARDELRTAVLDWSRRTGDHFVDRMRPTQ